jgi:ferric-dicitrate binding protein FerR (iron transport regulator)
MAGGRQCARLILILILASLNGWAAGHERGAEALGVLLGDASVRLNRQAVVPGMALFKGDVIQTGRASSAILNFRSGARATLGENSDLAVEWETSPTSLNLRQGVIVLQGAPARGTARVDVLGASVIVQGEGGFPAICRIAMWGGAAEVFNTRGHVEIHGAGAPFLLPGGQRVRLEAAGPQAAGQSAGKVSRAIPEETVQRSGQTTSAPLKIQDALNWEDLVRTLKNGRVQIALLDGSTLNVGARSELRVSKHDPATGQTSLEMTVGRLRADVVKISQPGGSFQVRTQTAVIGVVGTSFLVFATLNNTRVTCLEGLVSVWNINPAVVGTVTLHAGQFTNVPRGLPPTGAFQAPSGQVQTQISQTTVGGVSGAAQAAGAVPGGAPGGVGAVSNVTSNALNAGAAATGAGAAGLSGVTISRADSTSSLLSSASSNLSQTTQASNTVTSDSNSAAAASTSTAAATNTITQTVLSPSVPCGCQ